MYLVTVAGDWDFFFIRHLLEEKNIYIYNSQTIHMFFLFFAKHRKYQVPYVHDMKLLAVDGSGTNICLKKFGPK